MIALLEWGHTRAKKVRLRSDYNESTESIDSSDGCFSSHQMCNMQWTYLVVGRALHGLFGQRCKGYHSGKDTRKQLKWAHPAKIQQIQKSISHARKNDRDEYHPKPCQASSHKNRWILLDDSGQLQTQSNSSPKDSCCTRCVLLLEQLSERILFHPYKERESKLLCIHVGWIRAYFRDLPQVYMNSPALCHNRCQKDLDHLPIPQSTRLVHCVNDVFVRLDKQEVTICERLSLDPHTS